MALGSMNRTMNLPSLQRIAMEFERENDIMEQRQEMMDDAIDDAMDVGIEEEGDEVVEQVLEEIGVDLTQAVRPVQPSPLTSHAVHFANCGLLSSSEMRRKACNQPQYQRGGLPRPWAAAAVAATRATTTSRRVWTVYGGRAEQHSALPGGVARRGRRNSTELSVESRCGRAMCVSSGEGAESVCFTLRCLALFYPCIVASYPAAAVSRRHCFLCPIVGRCPCQTAHCKRYRSRPTAAVKRCVPILQAGPNHTKPVLRPVTDPLPVPLQAS